MGKMCGNMTNNLGIYRDSVSTSTPIITMGGGTSVIINKIA